WLFGIGQDKEERDKKNKKIFHIFLFFLSLPKRFVALPRIMAGWAIMLGIAFIVFIPQLLAYHAINGGWGPSRTVAPKFRWWPPRGANGARRAGAWPGRRRFLLPGTWGWKCSTLPNGPRPSARRACRPT